MPLVRQKKAKEAPKQSNTKDYVYKTYTIGERHVSQAQAYADNLGKLKKRYHIVSAVDEDAEVSKQPIMTDDAEREEDDEPVQAVNFAKSLEEPLRQDTGAADAEPEPIEPETEHLSDMEDVDAASDALLTGGDFTVSDTAISVASSPILQTLVTTVNRLTAQVGQLDGRLTLLEGRRADLEGSLADIPTEGVAAMVARIDAERAAREDSEAEVGQFIDDMGALLQLAGLRPESA